jgi:hypothetical protein
MWAKFGSSSTTRMQRVANGALPRSSAKRGMCFGHRRHRIDGATGGLVPAARHRSARVVARLAVLLRQHQGEHAALPGALLTLIEPPSKAARSRKSTGPGRCRRTAVGGAIGLAEGFEDAFLLIRGNADPRIAHDGNAGWPAMVRLTAPCSVNFTALDSRFLICSRRWRSVKHDRRIRCNST